MLELEALLAAVIVIGILRADRQARRIVALHKLGCLPDHVSGPYRRRGGR